MSTASPVLKSASEVIRMRNVEAHKQAFFDVVGGLSDQHLRDLEGALDRCSERQATFPEAVQFVLRRVKCIEDADRVVANLCKNKPSCLYADAA